MDNQQEEFGKLAYSVGFFLGDGCLYCNTQSSSYQLRFEKPDTECLIRVSGQLEEVFGNGGRIRVRYRDNHAPISVLIVCCKAAFDWFSANTLMRTRVPQLYFGAPKEVRQELLAGLMDSDGSVEQPRIIRFSNCELALVDAVRGLASSLGIPSGEVQTRFPENGRACYRMTLHARSYAEKMFFHCERKNVRLRKIRNYYFPDKSSETIREEYTGSPVEGQGGGNASENIVRS